ncbi:MAG: hypothetical protein KBE09_03160 [Candidatus Pacebacteria bacterium]|nr:hypothetical protein [Candidatus Paceibacterota bacterium]
MNMEGSQRSSKPKDRWTKPSNPDSSIRPIDTLANNLSHFAEDWDNLLKRTQEQGGKLSETPRGANDASPRPIEPNFGDLIATYHDAQEALADGAVPASAAPHMNAMLSRLRSAGVINDAGEFDAETFRSL